MRLSDAIALGRTLIKPTEGGPGKRGSGAGCALQLALMAIGEEYSAYSRSGPDFQEAIRIFGPIAGKIWRPFDTWGGENLDRFIDWVRSVEPAEVEPPVVESVNTAEEVPQEQLTSQNAATIGSGSRA
jgi:hypothetical protein